MNQLEYYLSRPDDFYVTKHSLKELYHINYVHTGLDWSNPWNIQARGIVLDGDSNIIARPYEKFFNYGELRGRKDLPREVRRLSEWTSDKYQVFEKLDGSLCIVANHEGEMLYASSGSLQGKYPHKFKQWFHKNLTPKQRRALKEYATDYTLLFEYVSPNDRIVVYYPKPEMILHGIIHTETGKEIMKPFVFRDIADKIGVKTANQFAMNLDNIKNVMRTDFGEDLFEGFVVVFEDGKRLKFKTEQYVQLHDEMEITFGDPDTTNKLKIYISMIDDGTVDDLIGMFESRDDQQYIDVINKVVKYYRDFNALLEWADDIVSEEGFSKKEYVKEFGDSKVSTLNQLVLSNHKRDRMPKFRENYILKQFGKV